MQFTKYLKLKTPEKSDYYNIDDFNENMNNIDSTIEEIDNTIEEIGNNPYPEKEISAILAEAGFGNMLNIALDINGENIYNGKGYKENTRWDPSYHKESEQTGIYLTGYIPCNKGDVFNLKNISMPYANDFTCVIYFFSYPMFDAQDEYFDVYDMTNSMNIVVDDSDTNNHGNIIQFTIPEDIEATHIRIQCGKINEKSTIAVNKKI